MFVRCYRFLPEEWEASYEPRGRQPGRGGGGGIIGPGGLLPDDAAPIAVLGLPLHLLLVLPLVPLPADVSRLTLDFAASSVERS